MKRRIFLNLALGLAAYLVFLISTIPAATAYGWFAGDLPAVRMGGLQGTVWTGHAAGLSFRGHTLGAADWNIHAWKLLLGRLSATIRITDGSDSLSGQASLSAGGNVSFSDLDAALSLGRVAPFLSLPPDMASGQLTAHLEQLDIPDTGPLSVRGRLVLSDLKLSWPQAMSLGDYAAGLDTDKGGLRARVRDASGPLEVQLIATLARSGQYRVDGTLAARSTAPGALKSALDTLGKAGTDGRHTLRLSGSLRGLRF